MIKESHTYAEWNWQLVGLCWSSACIDLLVWALNVWNQAFKVCSWWWRSLFSFFLLPISGPLPPFLFFCQLHQFSPLSLLPLPLAFLYDQKSKPLKTLSDQCRTVDTDSLLTATAAPSVCTQTDINHYRLDLEVCVSGLHLHSSNEFCLTLGMIGGSISDGGGVVVVCMLRAVNLHTCIYFLTLILSHVDELFHWACSIIGQFTVCTRLAFRSCIYLHCAAYYEKKDFGLRLSVSVFQQMIITSEERNT